MSLSASSRDTNRSASASREAIEFPSGPRNFIDDALATGLRVKLVLPLDVAARLLGGCSNLDSPQEVIAKL